jgi:hypothetical protein
MAGTSSACPCNWDADYGASSCAAQKPGVDRCLVWVCDDKINTITQVACAAGDTASGVVSDVTLNSATQGYRIFALEDSVNPQSGQSVNDNNGVDFNEVITGQGAIGNHEYCWMEANMDKKGYAFFTDNDGDLWMMHARLTEFNSDWGTQNGDFKGINFTFSNTKQPRVRKIDVSILGTYADNDAFLTAITTVWP